MLSFSPDFVWGDGSIPLDEMRACLRPTSVAQAILCLSQRTWAALAEQVFDVAASQLDLSMVLRKIEETNTCRNLDVPVEVYIDRDGDFTVRVYDEIASHPSENSCD